MTTIITNYCDSVTKLSFQENQTVNHAIVSTLTTRKPASAKCRFKEASVARPNQWSVSRKWRAWSSRLSRRATSLRASLTPKTTVPSLTRRSPLQARRPSTKDYAFRRLSSYSAASLQCRMRAPPPSGLLPEQCRRESRRGS